MNSRAISSFAAILASLGIIFMYVSPTWSGQIAITKAAIAADDKTIAAAKAFTAHEEELTTAEKHMDPDSLKRLNLLLPDSINTIGMIVDLNKLGSDSGLSVANVSISNTPAPSAVDMGAAAHQSNETSLDFQANAAGSYTALKAFMKAVEKSQRLINIQSVDVAGAAADTGVYTYLIKMRAYWLP